MPEPWDKTWRSFLSKTGAGWASKRGVVSRTSYSHCDYWRWRSKGFSPTMQNIFITPRGVGYEPKYGNNTLFWNRIVPCYKIPTYKIPAMSSISARWRHSVAAFRDWHQPAQAAGPAPLLPLRKCEFLSNIFTKSWQRAAFGCVGVMYVGLGVFWWQKMSVFEDHLQL